MVRLVSFQVFVRSFSRHLNYIDNAATHYLCQQFLNFFLAFMQYTHSPYGIQTCYRREKAVS